MRVNTNEEVDDDDMDSVKILKESKTSKRKCLIISGCGCILTLALITTILFLILFCQRQNEANTTNEQAVDLLDNLQENVGNFTDSDLNLFDKAFNTFDYNRDGFLNQTEFNEYNSIQISHGKTYDVIDVDNDTILSYPEVVAYLSEMVKNEYLFNTYLKDNVIMLVKYNYNYNISDSDPLFIEYAAMSMYFDAFDIDSNGYIRFNEYLLVLSKADFDLADKDLDGKLNKDEFFHVLYGNGDHSFRGLFQNLFEHDGTESLNKFTESVNSITLTMEQVENVQINLCPIKSTNVAQRRRLAKSFKCGWYNFMITFWCCHWSDEDPWEGKCCHSYAGEWLCYEDIDVDR